MPRQKTAAEAAAGKLVSAVQKVWIEQAGEPEARLSEEMLHRSHLLLHAAKQCTLSTELGDKSVAEWLGADWVRANPRVLPAIARLQRLVNAAVRQ